MNKVSQKRQLLIFAVAAAVAVILTTAVGISIYNAPANRLKRCLDLGNKYLTQQQYAAAIVEFEKAIAIDKRCVEAYEGGLAAYLGMEDLDGTQAFYDRVLGILEDLDAEFTAKHRDSVVELYLYVAEIYPEDWKKTAEILEKGCRQTGEDGRLKDKLAEVTTVRVAIRATDIEADSVFNNEGYGSLIIEGDAWDNVNGNPPPQAALADRNGSLIFPYKSTYRNYRVSGDIVSLTNGSTFIPTGVPWDREDNQTFYKIDGNEAFALESMWMGGPVLDGYAVAINNLVGNDASYYYREYQYYIIDKNGAIVCTPALDGLHGVREITDRLPWDYHRLGQCGEGLFAVLGREDTSTAFECKGYMDLTGNIAIDLSGKGYADLWSFHAGLAVVMDAGGMYGAIDRTGNLVIPCTYESMGSFSDDGLCEVKKDGRWGYIDRDNNVVIPFAYDGAYGAADGLASVGRDGKFGMVDYNNQEVVPLEYDDISSFENGVAYAVKDRTLYIIERSR